MPEATRAATLRICRVHTHKRMRGHRRRSAVGDVDAYVESVVDRSDEPAQHPDARGPRPAGRSGRLRGPTASCAARRTSRCGGTWQAPREPPPRLRARARRGRSDPGRRTRPGRRAHRTRSASARPRRARAGRCGPEQRRRTRSPRGARRGRRTGRATPRRRAGRPGGPAAPPGPPAKPRRPPRSNAAEVAWHPAARLPLRRSRCHPRTSLVRALALVQAVADGTARCREDPRRRHLWVT